MNDKTCHCGKVHPDCNILHSACDHDPGCGHHDYQICTCGGLTVLEAWVAYYEKRGVGRATPKLRLISGGLS